MPLDVCLLSNYAASKPTLLKVYKTATINDMFTDFLQLSQTSQYYINFWCTSNLLDAAIAVAVSSVCLSIILVIHA